jgi:hypothetical protein
MKKTVIVIGILLATSNAFNQEHKTNQVKDDSDSALTISSANPFYNR